VNHDTPDALEAKETVEAVIEVVRELPKTLEDEEEVALQSNLPVRSRGKEIWRRKIWKSSSYSRLHGQLEASHARPRSPRDY
jgi:hypothetical protein